MGCILIETIVPDMTLCCATLACVHLRVRELIILHIAPRNIGHNRMSAGRRHAPRLLMQESSDSSSCSEPLQKEPDHWSGMQYVPIPRRVVVQSDVAGHLSLVC
jgi:hypothetical protein